MGEKLINRPLQEAPEGLGAKDRIAVARMGLMGVSLGFLLMGRKDLVFPVLVAVVFFVIALFVPRFKVLGWWLTVVLTVLVLSMFGGMAVFFARNFSTFKAQSEMLTYRMVILIGLVLCGGVVALVGLVAKGTRQAVERRTNAALPGVF